jgi:hypothetical protein
VKQACSSSCSSSAGRQRSTRLCRRSAARAQMQPAARALLAASSRGCDQATARVQAGHAAAAAADSGAPGIVRMAIAGSSVLSKCCGWSPAAVVDMPQLGVPACSCWRQFSAAPVRDGCCRGRCPGCQHSGVARGSHGAVAQFAQVHWLRGCQQPAPLLAQDSRHAVMPGRCKRLASVHSGRSECVDCLSDASGGGGGYVVRSSVRSKIDMPIWAFSFDLRAGRGAVLRVQLEGTELRRNDPYSGACSLQAF